MTETEFNSKKFLASLTRRPGVYRMIGEQGETLYVGKARNLKNRVSTYFGSKAHHPKTQALMNSTARVEVTVTASEQEALLLEYNLIKQHKPRFNVLLRDDKSYPYIYVSTDHVYPRFRFHRGARKGKGKYFGPYPNADAVRQTLGQLQKLFMVRPCENSFFANRSRPCLQYQIRRCSAPCVDYITPAAYALDVRNGLRFLQGRNDSVLKDLIARMEKASASQDFETAARYRDQIKAIKTIQSQQAISGGGKRDADVLAVHADGGVICIAVVMIRNGRVLGSRHFFPAAATGTDDAELLGAFIAQHYFGQPPPPEIIVPAPVDDEDWLETMLTERAGQSVAIRNRVRGDRRRWLMMAETNARQGALQRRATHASWGRQFESLAEALALEETPARLECFDISHTSGEETMAACVVFGSQGPKKSDYRRFTIRDAAAGDDYAAIAEAVRRRYTRIKKGEAPLPDVLLIDGGKGQLKATAQVLADLQIDNLVLAGIAKGHGRKSDRDRVFVEGRPDPLRIAVNSPAMRLIQQMRDEAHRFAITGHRQRRSAARRESTLESVAGLGPIRRRALLRELGGLQGVRKAGVEDLTRVKGISRALAERVFDHLHGTGEPGS